MSDNTSSPVLVRSTTEKRGFWRSGTTLKARLPPEHAMATSSSHSNEEKNPPKTAKGMFWTEKHDVLLCREILVVDPFTGTKKKTVQRGAKWSQIADMLSQIQNPCFKVDQRAVRERYNLLAQKLRKKFKYEAEASGINSDMSELESLLEEIMEKETAAEEIQEQEQNGKNKDKENAQDIRNKAMERLAQTQKRKSESGEENKKKRRSNPNDTLTFLREKNEMLQQSKKEEMEMQKKQHELDAKKHGDFMELMTKQQQQQQKQSQDFQAMMMTLMTKMLDKQ